MQLKKYLVIDSKGSCKVTSTQPRLMPNEIAVQLELKIPEALFTKPQLQASISIPDKAVSPKVIAAEVIHDIEKVVHEHTGLSLKISVVQEPA